MKPATAKTIPVAQAAKAAFWRMPISPQNPSSTALTIAIPTALEPFARNTRRKPAAASARAATAPMRPRNPARGEKNESVAPVKASIPTPAMVL